MVHLLQSCLETMRYLSVAMQELRQYTHTTLDWTGRVKVQYWVIQANTVGKNRLNIEEKFFFKGQPA